MLLWETSRWDKNLPTKLVGDQRKIYDDIPYYISYLAINDIPHEHKGINTFHFSWNVHFLFMPF